MKIDLWRYRSRTRALLGVVMALMVALIVRPLFDRGSGGLSDEETVGTRRSGLAASTARVRETRPSPVAVRRSVEGETAEPPVSGRSDAEGATGAPGVAGSPDKDVERVYAARVIDRMTGEPLPDARCLAVVFHPTATDSTPNYAGLARALTRTTAEGEVWLPVLRPDDPRAQVYLQVDAPGYATGTAVLLGRDTHGGAWREVEVGLRRVATGFLSLSTVDGDPLVDAPLRVTVHGDGHAFDDEDPDSLEVVFSAALPDAPGRLVAPRKTTTRYTDAQGRLRLPASDYPYDVELLTPQHVLARLNDEGRVEQQGRLRIRMRRRGVRLTVLPGRATRHRVVDRQDFPLTHQDIEIAMDGRAPLRLRTDAHGSFELGLLPGLDPVAPEPSQRSAALTFLSPGLHGHSAGVLLSTHEETTTFIDVAPAGLLRFRVVAGKGAGRRTVVPRGPEISCDMTLVRLGADGTVEYRGRLPVPGDILYVHVRGFLPRRIAVGQPDDSGTLDLGDVELEEGLLREVAVPGAESTRGLRLLVAFRGDPTSPVLERQLYRFDGESRISVGGLRPGVYSLGVEGPGVETFTGHFEIRDASFGVPLEIPVESSVEEKVRLRGRIVDAPPEELLRAQVVERYFVRGRRTPLVMPAYPLSPDGQFGSVRRLAGVVSVEVTIVGRGGTGAHATLLREADRAATFEMGELPLERRVAAEIEFFAPGLGQVVPPLQVALEGEEGVEATARLGVSGLRLRVDNLRPGPYRLRWYSDDGGLETGAFTVLPGNAPTRLVALERSPLVEEIFEVEVTDGHGLPLAAARTLPPSPPLPWPYQPPIGRHLVLVRPRLETEFEFHAGGFLPAQVRVPPGGVVPTQVRLYRGVPVRATLLDERGFEVNGPVLVAWRGLRGGAVNHGVPLEVDVQYGQLVAELPPLSVLCTLRLLGKPGVIERAVAVPASVEPYDLGVLQFGEHRSVKGRVFSPRGDPVAEATVALVAPSDAFRFPLSEPMELTLGAYSTLADAQGHFRIDVPGDVPTGLVLVARKEGFGDAVEDPVDLEAALHDLTLEPAAHLEIVAGYENGTLHPDYRFALEFYPHEGPGESFELGEVAPELFGLQRYEAVRPGTYRLRWGLRHAYEPFPGLSREVDLLPGYEASLSLDIEGRILEGTAHFNGAPLASGWILLTSDPEFQESLQVGRVFDGRFYLLDPPPGFNAYAALIPETAPLPVQNIARGEAVPLAVRRYGEALRSGELRFDYAAHSLELHFSDHFLSHRPGATLSYQGYQWQGASFRKVKVQEAIDGPTVRFELLRPGVHRFGVHSARGSPVLNRVVDIRQDMVLQLR